MHARIYQITPAPIQQDDYLTEFDFIDSSFVGEIADSVDGRLDRPHELAMFGEHLQKALDAEFDFAGASFVISQTARKNTLQRRLGVSGKRRQSLRWLISGRLSATTVLADCCTP